MPIFLKYAYPVDCFANVQSVDNEIVLWEPKMKEQSPGEVRIFSCLCPSETLTFVCSLFYSDWKFKSCHFALFSFKCFLVISVQGSVDILQKYPVPECDIWFIKFSYDFHYNSAAIGMQGVLECYVPDTFIFFSLFSHVDID